MPTVDPKSFSLTMVMPCRLTSQSATRLHAVGSGLYVEESPEFRLDYCRLWRSLFTYDLPVVERIVKKWGLGDAQLFASATLMRPWRPASNHSASAPTSTADLYEIQMAAKQGLKNHLQHTTVMPKELIFIGRSLNLVRSNNKALGSPVNRIAVMAQHAVASLGKHRAAQTNTINGLMRRAVEVCTFRLSLAVLSVSFWWSRFKQHVTGLFGGRSRGFEDIMDDNMVSLANDMGFVVDTSMFDG